MIGEPILVMLVEDNVDHAELVIRTMEEHRIANKVRHFLDGQSGARVLRGGSFDDFDARDLLSSYRNYGTPGNRFGGFAFRCVVVVGGSATPGRLENKQDSVRAWNQKERKIKEITYEFSYLA